MPTDTTPVFSTELRAEMWIFENNKEVQRQKDALYEQAKFRKKLFRIVDVDYIKTAARTHDQTSDLLTVSVANYNFTYGERPQWLCLETNAGNIPHEVPRSIRQIILELTEDASLYMDFVVGETLRSKLKSHIEAEKFRAGLPPETPVGEFVPESGLLLKCQVNYLNIYKAPDGESPESFTQLLIAAKGIEKVGNVREVEAQSQRWFYEVIRHPEPNTLQRIHPIRKGPVWRVSK